jgi:TolA-binding protein
MKCQDADILITDDLYGELDPGRAEELREHLARCPACRKKRASYGRVVELHAAIPVAGPSAEVRDHILTQARSQARKGTRSGSGFLWSRYRLSFSAAAASLIIAAVALSIYVRRDSSSLIQPAKQDDVASVTSAAVEQERSAPELKDLDDVREIPRGAGLSIDLESPADKSKRSRKLPSAEPQRREPSTGREKKKYFQEPKGDTRSRDPQVKTEPLELKAARPEKSEISEEVTGEATLSAAPEQLNEGRPHVDETVAHAPVMKSAPPPEAGTVEAEQQRDQVEVRSDRSAIAASFKAAKEAEPKGKGPHSLYREARRHFLAGRWEEAALAYRTFLERNPDSSFAPDALMDLAAAYEKLDATDKALETLEHALKLHPERKKRIAGEIERLRKSTRSKAP